MLLRFEVDYRKFNAVVIHWDDTDSPSVGCGLAKLHGTGTKSIPSFHEPPDGTFCDWTIVDARKHELVLQVSCGWSCFGERRRAYSAKIYFWPIKQYNVYTDAHAFERVAGSQFILHGPRDTFKCRLRYIIWWSIINKQINKVDIKWHISVVIQCVDLIASYGVIPNLHRGHLSYLVKIIIIMALLWRTKGDTISRSSLIHLPVLVVRIITMYILYMMLST